MGWYVFYPPSDSLSYLPISVNSFSFSFEENTITAAREMKHYEVGSWAELHGCPLPTFHHLKPMPWNAGVPRLF